VSVEVSDREALELAIIENVQRTDLNPIEEAMGYQALANDFDYSHDEVAKIVRQEPRACHHTLRLLKLPSSCRQYVRSGKLTAGHARMLVGQPNAEEIANEIVTRGLNVRQVEAMARKSGKEAGEGGGGTKRRTGKDADTTALEKRVSDALGLQVTVDQPRATGASCTSPTAAWSNSTRC